MQYNNNNKFYYINTNEIPGELSRENMVSSQVKITWYFHM